MMKCRYILYLIKILIGDGTKYLHVIIFCPFSDNQIVKKLFDILNKLPASRREHMAVIIHEMIKSQKIHKDHFQMLWDAFGLTNVAWKKEESKFAVFILGVVGR